MNGCALMRNRFAFHLLDALGYLLCELAFKTECRGPFAWSYRAGCWCYGKATDVGICWGELVANPLFQSGTGLPRHVRRC
jgi:hypothetical protein